MLHVLDCLGSPESAAKRDSTDSGTASQTQARGDDDHHHHPPNLAAEPSPDPRGFFDRHGSLFHPLGFGGSTYGYGHENETDEPSPGPATPASTSVVTIAVSSVQDSSSGPSDKSSTSTTTTSTSGGTPTTRNRVVTTTDSGSDTVQSLLSSESPNTGTVETDLGDSGHVTDDPLFSETIPEPTSTLSVPSNITIPSSAPLNETMPSGNIFAGPIGTEAPPSNIPKKGEHPLPRLGVTQSAPIGTNKFYGNFYLGTQDCPSYLHPYSVAWAKGKGGSSSWGLSVDHVEASERVFGKPSPETGAVSYFVNPVGMQAVCMSAKELGPDTKLTIDAMTDTSAVVSLGADPKGQPAVRFPLAQGSAFVTGLYDGAAPVIETGVFFKTVTRSNRTTKTGVTKFRMHMEDGSTWLLYATHTKGNPLDLDVINNGRAESTGAFYGLLQVAKDPGSAEAVYDAACGAYATGFDLSGAASGSTGSYTFSFRKAGLEGTTLVMFALPHLAGSFDGETKGKMSKVQMQTTTKGMATAVVADRWTMVEPALPASMEFVPWSPEAGSITSLSDGTKSFIRNIALQEVSQNMLSQSDQDSMYFSGKVSLDGFCVGGPR